MQRLGKTNCQPYNEVILVMYHLKIKQFDMKHLTALIIFALFFTACKKETTPAQLGDNVLEAGNCLTNVQGQSNVSLCLDSVRDSRCPLNVMCIWQGVAEANFTLKTGTAEIKFKLATLKFKALGLTGDTTINNIRFILKDVKPYPGQIGYSTQKKSVELEIQ
jgi:hypothetical protein